LPRIPHRRFVALRFAGDIQVLAAPFFWRDKMKLKHLGIVAVLSLVLFSSKAAFAGDQDFTLTNKTGTAITKIFVSPHDASKWGDDIMGADTLADDGSVEIKFHRDEEAEYWDLKIVDKEGHEVVWENLKLTAISKVKIHIEDGKATAELE
jgi:hypothetical protein